MDAPGHLSISWKQWRSGRWICHIYHLFDSWSCYEELDKHGDPDDSSADSNWSGLCLVDCLRLQPAFGDHCHTCLHTCLHIWASCHSSSGSWISVLADAGLSVMKNGCLDDGFTSSERVASCSCLSQSFWRRLVVLRCAFPHLSSSLELKVDCGSLGVGWMRRRPPGFVPPFSTSLHLASFNEMS